MAISLDKTPFKIGNRTENREVWRQAISFHPFIQEEYTQVFYYEYDMVDGVEVDGTRRDKMYYIKNITPITDADGNTAAFNEFDYWADFDLISFVKSLDPSIGTFTIAQLLNGKIRLQLSRFPIDIEDRHVMVASDNNS